jgi:hypothetical protein
LLCLSLLCFVPIHHFLRSSFTSHRRQVRTYRALGVALGFHGTDSEDGPSGSRGGGAGSAGVGSGGMGEQLLGPLEGLLVQKNKGLEHELTVLRMQLAECRVRMESLRRPISLSSFSPFSVYIFHLLSLSSYNAKNVMIVSYEQRSASHYSRHI